MGNPNSTGNELPTHHLVGILNEWDVLQKSGENCTVTERLPVVAALTTEVEMTATLASIGAE